MNYLNEQYGHSGLHAKLVAASITERGEKILTIETKAPKFIDAEFEKHRMMSSSSSSSRAKPFDILDEMYVPFDIRQQERGMQGYEQADWDNRGQFIETTRKLYVEAINRLIKFKDDIHKQHLNRYVEPWMYQYKVVTSTEWDNFFSLRLAPDVQPEMLELAKMMKRAYDAAEFTELEPGEWHLPFEMPHLTPKNELDYRKGISVAGCARVSYGVLGSSDGKARCGADDLKLSDFLLESMHMTPFEHQATPMKLPKSATGNPTLWQRGITHMDRNNNLWSGNFKGWIQNRQLLQRWN